MYVDDVIIIGNSPSLVNHLIHKIAIAFALRDLGDLHSFLGIQVHYTLDGILLSQESYLRALLHSFGMANSKPCSTPMVSGLPLSK